MRTICLYFEIHQIIHLKRYRFFDIGNDHYYYDDYANETGMNEVAERSYLPALSTLVVNSFVNHIHMAYHHWPMRIVFAKKYFASVIR